MTTSPTSPFLFVVCQPGAEAWLKAELEREHGLKPAYGRPGFVTFKHGDPAAAARFDADLALRSVFARAYGVSFGQQPLDPAALLDTLARQLPRDTWPLALHVFEREPAATKRDPLPETPGARADALRAELLAAAPAGMFAPEPRPSAGQLVVDVVVMLEPDLLWFGLHRHRPRHHHPAPGGNPRLVLPADAPSRVYLKLEEGLRWSGLPMAAGDRVLDLGCAPGGGSWALLARGLEVVGVDPATVDARVLAHPRFEHLRLPFERIDPSTLSRIDWLVFDVNLSPRLTLKALGRLVRSLPDLRGMLLTLKLNTDALAEQVPWMLERVRAMGMDDVRATQLVANRQEICVAARP